MFDPEVPLDMQPVLGAGGEGPGAEVTPEGPVPGVDPDVLLEVPLLTERLCAVRTLEGFFPLVPADVGRETCAMLELLATLVTEELGVCIVHREVGLQIAVGLE